MYISYAHISRMPSSHWLAGFSYPVSLQCSVILVTLGAELVILGVELVIFRVGLVSLGGRPGKLLQEGNSKAFSGWISHKMMIR